MEQGLDDHGAGHDLRRLESSFLWLQSEGAANRAVPLLPPLTRAADKGASARPRDTFNRKMPQAFVPEHREAPPPAHKERRHRPRGALLVLMASVIAAPAGYYVSYASTGAWPLASATLTALISDISGPPASPTPQEEPQPSAEKTSSQTAEQATDIVDGNFTALSADVPPPDPSSAPSVPIGNAARKPYADEVKLLMSRGTQFMTVGDLVSARLVFQRAAEAHDPAAALALGATYDPVALVVSGVPSMGGDIDKARTWYQRAQALGSFEAPGRLALLVRW